MFERFGDIIIYTFEKNEDAACKRGHDIHVGGYWIGYILGLIAQFAAGFAIGAFIKELFTVLFF
ncbi:MAG: hypothetical protein NC311_18295 [Muribaculaceae bacterium]|nr:hypothetical protein [Muribaculaceae bacterium]